MKFKLVIYRIFENVKVIVKMFLNRDWGLLVKGLFVDEFFWEN